MRAHAYISYHSFYISQLLIFYKTIKSIFDMISKPVHVAFYIQHLRFLSLQCPNIYLVLSAKIIADLKQWHTKPIVHIQMRYDIL